MWSVLLNSSYYNTNHNNCWLKMRSILLVGRSVTVLQCVCRFRSRTERLMRLTCVSQTRPRQPRMIGPIFYRAFAPLLFQAMGSGEVLSAPAGSFLIHPSWQQQPARKPPPPPHTCGFFKKPQPSTTGNTLRFDPISVHDCPKPHVRDPTTISTTSPPPCIKASSRPLSQ